MISKHQLMMRIINLEDIQYNNELALKKLEKRIKDLEKPKKPSKKSK